MKTLLLALAISGSSAGTHAQGTVNFSNQNIQHGVNAPVYESDGMTLLAGSQFMASLLGGPSSNNITLAATTAFLSQGYFFGGSQQIIGVAPENTAWVRVDVWNTASGATFAQAQASGLPNSWWQSSIFPVMTGGGGPTPFPPGALVGLGTSPVFLNGLVPEPSTFGLGLVGTLVALFRLRRRNFVSESLPQQRRFDDRAGD